MTLQKFLNVILRAKNRKNEMMNLEVVFSTNKKNSFKDFEFGIARDHEDENKEVFLISVKE